MNKYYTMKKYIGLENKCDDCKYAESGYGNDFCGNCIHGKSEDNYNQLEPKVLSVEKYIKGLLDGENILHQYPSIELFGKDCFIGGDKNGQLREWLRPEQVGLREAVKELRQYYPNDLSDTSPIGRVFKAFNNLKSPYNETRTDE